LTTKLTDLPQIITILSTNPHHLSYIFFVIPSAEIQPNLIQATRYKLKICIRCVPQVAIFIIANVSRKKSMAHLVYFQNGRSPSK
jgi:hypothetical protein